MTKNEELKDTFIVWSPDLSVGFQFIDDQHKMLIQLLNDLASHRDGNTEGERDYLKGVIKELVDYAKVHFATEEDLMLQTGFQGYDEHKREHEKFVLNVVGLVKDFNNNKSTTAETLITFLRKWILNHIAGTDKNYSGYFKEHGIKDSKKVPRRAGETVPGK